MSAVLWMNLKSKCWCPPRGSNPSPSARDVEVIAMTYQDDNKISGYVFQSTFVLHNNEKTRFSKNYMHTVFGDPRDFYNKKLKIIPLKREETKQITHNEFRSVATL